jgi:tRNA (guanine37-N1)-methyltransferase
MRFEIVTIFPAFFTSIFEHGILRRALAEELVTVGIHDLRNFTHDRHRTVDDRPFGGGEGMVLKPEPLAEALASLGIEPKGQRAQAPLAPPQVAFQRRPELERAQAPLAPPQVAFQRRPGLERAQAPLAPPQVAFQRRPELERAQAPLASPQVVVMLSAQGRPFTQALARELAAVDRVVLLCGRYEGVDERINELYCDFELSIGDYVLSGGELAAAIVVDAVTRLIPGALGNQASGEFESFGITDAEITTGAEGVPRSQHGSGGLLDYPHYTRPAEFGGVRAPEVLLNGDHLQIRRWRREQQLRKTFANRPDLLAQASLSKEDKKLLDSLGLEDQSRD